MQFHDADGNDEYPIVYRKPLYVLTDLLSPDTYSKLTLDIAIYSWGGFLGCEWHKIPTFGLLSNLDACTNGLACPIEKGRHNTTIILDFSKYGKIIGLLTDDAPYQTQVVLTDKASKKSTCAYVQVGGSGKEKV